MGSLSQVAFYCFLSFIFLDLTLFDHARQTLAFLGWVVLAMYLFRGGKQCARCGFHLDEKIARCVKCGGLTEPVSPVKRWFYFSAASAGLLTLATLETCLACLFLACDVCAG